MNALALRRRGPAPDASGRRPSGPASTRRLLRSLALLPALIAAGCPWLWREPRSDDFNSCEIDTVAWQLVDPRGDSSATLVGGGTGDARLELSVPGGVTHDPWNVNNAARLMQDTLNVDFEIEAKFDSPVTQRFQSQGLMVEASPTDWVRFDVYHDGTDTHLFAADIVGGSGTVHLNATTPVTFPLHLRLARVGDQWTASYSSDGQSWTVADTFEHAMVVRQYGVFAGNDGNTAPAHTAAVDYFQTSTDPLVDEDLGPIPQQNELQALRTGEGTLTVVPRKAAYACGETVTLSAQPDPGWTFQGWQGDVTGQETSVELSMVGDRKVHASFQPIGGPPTISDVAIEAGNSSATITWTTNHPSSSSVEYGETTGYELGSVDDPTPVKSHSVTLSDLAPGTAYHARITSENESGLAASSGDLGFTTTSPPPSLGVISDDFNECALEPSVWTFVDPLQDSQATLVGSGTGDAQLHISVPAGTAHDPWNSNLAARLMQVAGNGDLEIEAKFDSPVTERFQEQGLMVESIGGGWLRFDVYSDGTSTRLFGGTVTAEGAQSIRLDETIPSVFPIHLRLLRQGDLWTALYSFDGQGWTTAGSFTHAMAVSLVGVFAGNDGPDPAHTAVVDYFQATADPLVDEDAASIPAENALTLSTSGSGTATPDPDQALYVCGQSVQIEAQPAPLAYFTGWSGDLSGTANPETVVMNVDRDVTATFAPVVGSPTISDIEVVGITESTAVVEWTTDHPSTSSVAYGETSAYELGSVDDTTLTARHAVLLSGLQPFTAYHFRVSSENEIALTASSGDLVFITQPAGGPGGPLVTSWYGDLQRFGDVGAPQPFVNVLGNVLDADGVASLSYSLNDGPSIPLSLGPDEQRLADPGDFNVDIPNSSLQEGTNTVTITATDEVGDFTDKTVVVNYAPGNVWPDAYAIDWSTVDEIEDVAQVVDGLWQIDGDALRTVQVDYDRLVAIGDVTWQDYEAVVPVTIHGFDPEGFGPFSNRPGVGLLMRWRGHLPPGQPQRGFDLGAIGFYRIGETGTNRLEMWTDDSQTSPALVRDLAFDVIYVFKMQVETLPTAHQYRFKVWEQGQPEPAGWDLVEDQALAEAPDGSLVLVAHHVDASFGTVTVTPLP